MFLFRARFVPQEMVQREFEGETLDRIDIFGLGAVVFEMMTNQELPTLNDPQWKVLRTGSTMKDAMSGIEQYSLRVRDLVGNMVSVDPTDRPTANAIVGMLAALEDPVLQQKEQQINQLKHQIQMLQNLKQNLRLQSPTPMKPAAMMGTGARFSAKRGGK